MPHAPEGYWYPDLFPKQLEVFNSRAGALLASGPSLSGKTWSTLHKIVRHLWDTDGARAAMFSKTMKNAKLAGTWDDINRIVLAEWIKAGIGLEYTTKTNMGNPGPKVDGSTRTPLFTIRNRHGGESECMLFSLDFIDDIEDKVKEQRFSCIYFSELDKFNSRKVLSVTQPRLRMPHLKMADHLWLADTNPSSEGEASWIYEVWWMERTMSYQDYIPYCEKRGRTPMPEDAFYRFQKSLELIEIQPEENVHLEPEKLQQLKEQYSYDPELYARYVKGKWVWGFGDKSRHFRAQFKEDVHVVGSCEGDDESKWEYANPSPACVELPSGWDLGDVNHAAVIADKTIIKNRPHFTILDELVTIGEEVSIEAFTLGVMGLINNLERITGRQFDLTRAWSDSSSLTKYNASADTYQHLQVMAYSGNRIELQGVEKASGSVRLRVQLLKQLLVENRIKVSAHCHKVIKMLKELKRGKGLLDFVVMDENKHIFDALTYMLLKECAEEVEMLTVEQYVGRREKFIVSV